MQIELSILSEAYEKREITDIAWVTGQSNPADGFTKSTPNAALQRLLEQAIYIPETQRR